MVQDARGHVIPAGADGWNYKQQVAALSLSVNDVMTAADLPSAEAKLADLTAAGVNANGTLWWITSEGRHYTRRGDTWRALLAAPAAREQGTWTLPSFSLDGTVDPATAWNESAALPDVTLAAGVWTIGTAGLYAVSLYAQSDDSTADTGHDALVRRNGAVLAQTRQQIFAPAGGTGLGLIRSAAETVTRLSAGDTLSVYIRSIGTGGRSATTAEFRLERLAY